MLKSLVLLLIMKHIVFAPLKENYETIHIRSSELNSYVNPSPYWFPNEDSRAECMNLWDRIHDIVQYTMLMWEDKWHQIADKHIKELEFLWPFEREKEFRWFTKAAHNYVELSKHKRCSYIECKRQIIIEYSWYLIIFSWQSDADDDEVLNYDSYRMDRGCEIDTIIDIKSAWSKRDDTKANLERQKYYYSWLKWVYSWNENDIRFRYDIYTKQATPQAQEFEFIIPFKTAEMYLKNDLRAFLTAKSLARNTHEEED